LTRAPIAIEEIWRRYDEVESRLTAPLSERMLDLAELRPDMRVLDLATGRGEPALRAARRVGPRGAVVGVDRSAALLRMAREKADREGLANLELRAADAEAQGEWPPRHFHAVTCRWGLMYMTAPVTVLAHARRALLPSGALVGGRMRPRSGRSSWCAAWQSTLPSPATAVLTELAISYGANDLVARWKLPRPSPSTRPPPTTPRCCSISSSCTSTI
jgi:ubiquinone/menaquinone biosynthesis C-methylase UbiE